MVAGRTRSAGTALGAAAIALLAAGCGGAAKQHAAAKPKVSSGFTVPTTPAEPAVSKAAATETFTIADSTAPAAGTRHRTAKAGAATPNAPAPPSPSSTDAGAAVRQAISDTLAVAGWSGAQVDVRNGGLTVNVALPRTRACGPNLPTGSRLLSQIRADAPGARTVTIVVAGTGLDLAAYRRTRCAAPRSGTGGGGNVTGAAGSVVYSTDGAGPFTTPEFAISGRSWTVAYRNRSDFFQAFVVRNGRNEPFVINSTHPGSGTETLRTGPGRFRLKISAGDGWSVVVRDVG